jgi:hypothetical protein
VSKGSGGALEALPSRGLAASKPVVAIPAARVLAIEAPRRSAADPLGLEEMARQLVPLSVPLGEGGPREVAGPVRVAARPYEPSKMRQ